MAEAVNPEKIVEAAAIGNIKTVGEGTAFFTNLAHGNAVAHQQAMYAVLVAATTKAIEALLVTSPSEAGGELAALQGIIKSQQTIPPVTP